MNNFKLAKSVKVEMDGRIVIPTDIVSETGFPAGSEVIIIKRAKSILLFPKQEFIPFLNALSDRMQEQMEATGGLEADAKFLFELSVKEYTRLSENKEKELRDRHYAQESKRLDEIEEADIGD